VRGRPSQVKGRLRQGSAIAVRPLMR
jgi:hypothetical protein